VRSVRRAVSKEKSEVHVGKGQTFEMAGLSKVALSIVHGFDAASTNVLVTSMATSGAVVKTRVAPAVATDTGGHEKWIPVRVVVLRASALGLTLFLLLFFFFFPFVRFFSHRAIPPKSCLS
jgi:hypothetical protein